MGILDRLDEWDMCAIAEERYYIILPNQGKYIFTKHFGNSTGTDVREVNPSGFELQPWYSFQLTRWLREGA